MRRLAMALALIAAACTGNGTDAVEPTSTTAAPVAEPASTSTSTTVAATTTEAPQPKRVLPGARLQPGTVYEGELRGVGVEFEVQLLLDGWEVRAIGAEQGSFVIFSNTSQQDLPAGAEASLVLWNLDKSISETAALHRSGDLVDQAGEPIPTTLGGGDALVFDLLQQTVESPDNARACRGVDLLTDRDVSGLTWVAGINACTWTRMWVVDVDGFAVSVYVSAAPEISPGVPALDPENVWQIDDFQPLLDDFINGLTLCTTATPCDN